MSIRLNEKEIKIALAGVNRKALSSSVFASAPTPGRTQNLLLHAQDRKHTQLSCRTNSSSPFRLPVLNKFRTIPIRIKNEIINNKVRK